MGMWKLSKKPDSFPAKFTEAVCAGIGETVLARGTHAAMRTEQRRFSAFRSSCRRFPLYSASQALEIWDAQTKIEEAGDLFILVLYVRKSQKEILAVLSAALGQEHSGKD